MKLIVKVTPPEKVVDTMWVTVLPRAAGKCRIVDESGRDVGTVTFTFKPPAGNLECVRRGNVIETIECTSCGGRFKNEVFACELHGRCTLRDLGNPGDAVCRLCPDRLERR